MAICCEFEDKLPELSSYYTIEQGMVSCYPQPIVVARGWDGIAIFDKDPGLDYSGKEYQIDSNLKGRININPAFNIGDAWVCEFRGLGEPTQ